MYNTVYPTTLEIELSTKCNAACPQCSRNYFGAYTWPTLSRLNLDFETLKSRFPIEFLKSLKKIRLFGTYGDPCMHKEFLDIISWLTEHTSAQIIISTNGGLRSTSWWKKLATILRPQDKVIFCVDGLEDTNHLYRKNTKFKKIVDNIKSFNRSGGKSLWHFIVFKHNQHQVKEAEEYSKNIGCEAFAIKKTARFINKQHQRIDQFPVLNKNETVSHWLKLPTIEEYKNDGYKQYSQIIATDNDYKTYLKNVDIKCIAQKHCAVYISAEGYVLPCGWLADRFYGFEAENHNDRQKLFDMIESSGGFDQINLFKNSLSDIINGKFFTELEKSWSNDKRLDRCANQCGDQITAYSTSAQNLNEIIK